MKINFPIEITAADTNKRTLTGRIVSWNEEGSTSAGLTVFEKRVKSFARTFGVAFSGAALVAFSKKAIKAFSDDEAAAKSLQLQLENTGNAFRVTEVEDYIKGLEKTYAILTDLRKPFQTFLNLTRSVGLSQRTLEAALNISAGTGQSLETVEADMCGEFDSVHGIHKRVRVLKNNKSIVGVARIKWDLVTESTS